MDKLRIFTKDEISSWISFRPGETKLGEEVFSVRRLEELSKLDSKFVILGVPEDYGVLANHGVGGADTAWVPFLKAFLNLQNSPFLKGNDFILLGQLEIDKPTSSELEHLRQKVHHIDNLLYPIVQQIIASGKIPIVIGGGHNNAYGMIKGFSLAQNKKINIINIDAHADLRDLEGRHSGNGFSYAIHDEYLDQYGIFGLQQNYLTSFILHRIETNSKISPVFYEDLLLSEKPIADNFQDLLLKIPAPKGLEIDLDSIEHVLSSACSPSGFKIDEIRKILLKYGADFKYLHLCEGVFKLKEGRENPLIGKTIAFLVSDFAKSICAYNSSSS